MSDLKEPMHGSKTTKGHDFKETNNKDNTKRQLLSKNLLRKRKITRFQTFTLKYSIYLTTYCLVSKTKLLKFLSVTSAYSKVSAKLEGL